MRIERESIRLAPINLAQVQIDGRIHGVGPHSFFKLGSTHMKILELMAQKKSLSEIVLHHLSQGIWVQFLSFRELVEFLLSENLLTNASFRDYFRLNSAEASSSDDPSSFLESLIGRVLGRSGETIDLVEEIHHLPFFRSLDPKLRDVMIDHCRALKVAEGKFICRNGRRQRNLYALIEGQASVQRPNSSGASEKLAVLPPGSVFGERGFFLDEPRSADVITDTESLIVQFRYVPEIFDDLIKSQTARELQKRFWVIHALLKSEVFRHIPDDCFDALIFAGSLVSLKDETWICREGELGDRCYIIVQGTVSVSQKGRFLHNLGQGDCFGEIALIMNGGRRSASVRAESGVLALELPAVNFYQLLADNFMLACEFERVAIERIRNDHRAG